MRDDQERSDDLDGSPAVDHFSRARLPSDDAYTLTNQRLATREDVIRRSGRDIPLTGITDVAFEQGILDRMTSAGTLRVSAASEHGVIVLHTRRRSTTWSSF